MDSGTQIMCYLDRNIVRVFDVLVLESLSLSAKVHLSLFWVVLVNWKISVYSLESSPTFFELTRGLF